VAAIECALSCFASPGEYIVLGDEMYSDTPKVAQELVEKKLAAGCLPLSRFTQKASATLLAETCSNPSSHCFDMACLRDERFGKVCLDNTWLSGCNFNPLSSDRVDCVIESASKYLSASTCIAGMCIVKLQHSDVFFRHIARRGLHVAPQVCEQILSMLPSVSERYERASRFAGTLTPEPLPCPGRWSPPVFTLNVPNTHALFAEESTVERNYAARKAFVNERLKALCKRHGVAFETSFGAAHSRLDTYPKIRAKAVQLRFAVGFAGASDLDHLRALLTELSSSK
jgi:hypothetical protein